ncbi:hypothetical protein UlMin_025930 [Ulmus minor]
MGNVEIPNWLEGLPLAPEFRPTDTEFADPIAYISKIEKEASAFGICKVIPPLPKPSKKYVYSNLNKSLSKCPELGSNGNSLSDRSSSKLGSSDCGNDGEPRAVFTTRQQELGQSVKKTKGVVQNPVSGVHKQVWQSGAIYTIEQFESKSKVFARNLLGVVKELSPLVIEAMFWKTASEKPIYIEYANDVPGSAFGEPEGQFRFHRRRRRRNFYRRSGESSQCKENETSTNSLEISHTNDSRDAFPKNDPSTCLESKVSTTPATLSSDETSQSSRKKSQNSSCDIEGTAGWKLSNSPWNLQVISRAPGSLTRFMPDDIPGVTSPMVYIGMLFSWFAWHVEDHELHSMNFLHNGSSKTWYSVPGDYAFAFEELVRSEAYGGNIDRLAALALLGEKTTLMSPELVVASGIPCCRLIQNPGEFVVTFPRAYHVGFSHGFNCGEAANFGTPQWLKVAKEAAVRRAAMSYLPMLSHQQLLYLLTMSFVTSVPRSLLPGVRSSRLRDRQKEEREFLVKKEFIEDILNENHTLTVLLGKDSSYKAVLWNADLLSYPSKDPLSPPIAVDTGATTPGENAAYICPGKSNEVKNHLLEEMSLYMENLNNLNLDGCDLSCDFQVDSGTLVCIACGILGFPFMSVVQPSEKASEELHNDHFMGQEQLGVSGLPDSLTLPYLEDHDNGSVNGNPLRASDSPSMDSSVPSVIKFDKSWNTSNKFLRPRSFCLEHALEIVELLQGKGGVKVLVICHSDYQKIKAHAATISEEIGSPFNYSEFPLDVASKEELNLIDLAIDGEKRNYCGEDWTSELGINLQNCVKIRKNSPSKQVQHALTLGGLFYEKSCSDVSNIKWHSRKSRSKKISHPTNPKPCENTQTKNDEVFQERSSTVKQEKLIQYSRRNKRGGSTGAGMIFASNRMCENIQMQETTNGTQYKNCNLEDRDIAAKVNLTSDASEMVLKQPASPFVHASDKRFGIHEQKQIVGQSNQSHEDHNLASQSQSNVLADENVSVNEVSDVSKMTSSQDANPHDDNSKTQIEKAAVDKVCMSNEVGESMTLDNEIPKVHAIIGDDGAPVWYNSTATNDCTVVSKEECYEGQREINSDERFSYGSCLEGQLEQEIKCSANEMSPASSEVPNSLRKAPESCPGLTSDRELLQKADTTTRCSEDLASSSVTHMEINECPEVPKESMTEEDSENDATSENVFQQETQITNQCEQEFVFTAVTEAVNHPIARIHEEIEDPRPSAEDNSHDDSILDNNDLRKSCTSSHNGEETILPTPISFRKYSRAKRETCTKKDTCNSSEVCSLQDEKELDNVDHKIVDTKSNAGKERKRKREVEQLTENKLGCNGFIKSPCEGLRPRAGKERQEASSGTDFNKEEVKEKRATKVKKPSKLHVPPKDKKENSTKSHRCDLEGCRMSFDTKAALTLHKMNRCPHEGCGTKFSSHKYAMIHHRVHEDQRPLKCPWKGCTMSFKWAWARTEHIRVHTGERPYKCQVDGCGLSFRFVSDFSRHRRKTGHYVK